MKRLIIADSHVGTLDGDADAMVEFLERCAETGFSEVIYLGDAFQYLIGMDKFWTTSIHRVLEAWDRLRSRGLSITLIEGNRDFFLDDPDLAARIDGSGMDLEFVAGGTRYRLVHGDRVNHRDLRYLFWSRVSKSAVARVWARWLPPRLATRIVRTMEARLATTNRKFRYVKPVDALKREAELAFSVGVDLLLWGHFHSAWRYQGEEGLAMVVPAWLDYRTALVVEDDGRWSVVDEKLEPVTVEYRDDGR